MSPWKEQEININLPSLQPIKTRLVSTILSIHWVIIDSYLK